VFSLWMVEDEVAELERRVRGMCRARAR